MAPSRSLAARWWHRRQEDYSVTEIVIDAVVHGIGIVLAVAAGSVLLVFALGGTAPEELPALLIYLGTMVTLLAISMSYNLVRPSAAKLVLASLDQAAIFLFIAGTYTPFALISLPPETGYPLFLLAWGTALCGVLLKLFFTGRFDILSTIMYVLMGWMVLLFLDDFIAVLSSSAMAWLAAGGIAYTLGAVMYSISRIPMGHAIFHVCVVLGSLCHYICVYFFVLG